MTNFLSRLRHDRLFAGLASYGTGELVSRVARVGAIVVIARQVSPVAMGIATLATSLFELIRVLANAGIGQTIIAADERDLAGTCRTAARLFWYWCALVAALQLVVATILSLAFAQPEAGILLALLAAVYLLMPPGLVSVFLLMREGRLGTTARIATAQTMSEHLLSMLLALIWPSAAALVVPKLLTVPIWLIGVRRARPWHADITAAPVPASRFTRYGAGVLGTEIATAARGQIDKLIIAALCGTRALGIWAFAFGAGLGITNSIVGALSIVLLPHLCAATDAAERDRRLRAGIMLALTTLVPMVLLQVTLAPVYVPILFGHRWANSASLVSLLGLAALPMILAAVASAKLRATARTGRDAGIGTTATVTALAGVTIGAGHGLHAAAAGYVAALWLTLIPAAIVALRPDRPRHLTSTLKELVA